MLFVAVIVFKSAFWAFDFLLKIEHTDDFLQKLSKCFASAVRSLFLNADDADHADFRGLPT